MRRAWLKHVLLGSVCIAAFLFLYMKTQAVNSKGHDDLIGYIQELSQIDAELSSTVLMSRYGTLASYDPFVSAVERSKSLQASLQENPSTLYRKGYKDVDEFTDKAMRLFLRKEYLLELFKSKNALLQNSLRYFPAQVVVTVGDDAKGLNRPDEEMRRELRDLGVDVLHYTVAGNEEVKKHVIADSEAIAKKLDRVPESVRDNIKLILVHAKIIVQQKPAVDALVDELLRLPSRKNYLALNRAYDTHYHARVDESNRYRIGLYVLPVLLSIYIIYVLVKLRRNTAALSAAVTDLEQQKRKLDENHKKLATFNRELEERVHERTVELNSTNEQLVYYLDDLTHKNEENEMFVYSVSHDLRSPLVNLQGFSQELIATSEDMRKLLSTHECPPELKKRGLALIDEDMAGSIRFIQAGVMRLSNIIDALLRLSRAGRVEYHKQFVDLNQTVRRIVDSVQSVATQSGAVIQVKDLPQIWGDATAVEQIFANLIGNALNYLDPGRPGVIEVGYLHQPEETRNTALNVYYVKDNGLGISDSAKAKLFHIFQRFHPNSAKGEGVGLSIVRRMVERHGGRVTVESKEGEGTTFFVTLPAREIKQAPVFEPVPGLEMLS